MSDDPVQHACDRCGADMRLRSMAPVQTDHFEPRPRLRMHYRCPNCGHECDVVPTRDHSPRRTAQR